MQQNDPLSYYVRLGVPLHASAGEIKTAFRRRARDLHPDRNPSPTATLQFQHLQEAYAVLKDPEARARYDTDGVATPAPGADTREEEHAQEPIVCSSCGQVTAQPRYVIYFTVKRFVFVTRRSPTQGILCAPCAERKVLRATAVTWLLGWWGFPWGLVYSIHALTRNLIGGLRPPDINARLLGYQAWVFTRLDRRDLARAVARDALAFAEKTKRDPAGLELRRAINELLVALDDGTPIRRLRTGWRWINRPFLVQTALAVVVTASIMGLAVDGSPSSPPITTTPVVSSPAFGLPQGRPPTPVSPPRRMPPPKVPLAVAFNEPSHALPPTGEYRRYWSHTEDEVLAPLKIITAPGGTHHFVKVVDWTLGRPVMTIFVRSGETVEVAVPIGTYALRYAAGSTWYGGSHLFGPATSYARADKRLDFVIDGDRVSGFSVELVKQVGGNLKTVEIRPEEFQAAEDG